MRSLPKSVYWFMIGWLVLNLIQSATTGLMNDETYYWVYTQFPDWGYLDHPPGVMVVIWLGEFLGHSPITLRIVSVLLSTVALGLMIRLMPGKEFDLKAFALLFLSFPLFHIFGFVTVPDTPLLFFCTLFFFVLKAYLKEATNVRALCLLFAVVGMVYSKYHAVLVLFFTILALPKLLADRRFYFVLFASILLYLPHIVWQVSNDYPSIQYHLFERSDIVYRLDFTTGYLAVQLIILGPLSFWFILRSAARYLDGFSDRFATPEKRFRRVMLLQFWGFFGFFFLMSFKGTVEGNWTAPMLLPALYLAYSFYKEQSSQRLRKVAIPLLAISTVLSFGIRFLMAVPVSPLSEKGNLKEFHHNSEWARDIKQGTNNLPVVFYDGYKYPSIYWYYEGIPAHAESDIKYRLTQYDLWSIDTAFTGKKVAWVAKVPGIKNLIEHDYTSPTKFVIDTSFYSLHALEVQRPDLPPSLSRSETQTLGLVVKNTADYIVKTPRGHSYGIGVSYVLEREVVDTFFVHFIDKAEWQVGEEYAVQVELDQWPETGSYKMRVSLQKFGFWPSLTGLPHEVIITE